MMAVSSPRIKGFPRSVSVADVDWNADLPSLHQHDVGVFWDLRRYHLGLDVVSVEAVVLALKYRAGLIKNFCSNWLGMDGLNVLTRFAVVCDLPSDAALEIQRQSIIRVFDDLQMQFCNIGGHTNPAVARREGIDRFVLQFVKDFPRPILVVISDDLRLLQSVKEKCGSHDCIPIICRNRGGRISDAMNRIFYNRLLAFNIVTHPFDVFFYETAMSVTIKGHGYPRNVLQILYAKTRDTGTLLGPFAAWSLSLVLKSGILYYLNQPVR